MCACLWQRTHCRFEPCARLPLISLQFFPQTKQRFCEGRMRQQG